MNTYTGENPSNTQGGGNEEKTDSVEDLFLPGGFDSFGGTPEPMNVGMEQMNSSMGQLGSVDYGNAYGTVYSSTNRWANPVIFLNFKEQILNSFMPARYDRYKGMSEGAAKEFVKSFTRLYLRIGYLMIAFMMLGVVVLAYWIFPLLLYPIAVVSSIFSIVQLIVPIVIMALAIPGM